MRTNLARNVPKITDYDFNVPRLALSGFNLPLANFVIKVSCLVHFGENVRTFLVTLQSHPLLILMLYLILKVVTNSCFATNFDSLKQFYDKTSLLFMENNVFVVF